MRQLYRFCVFAILWFVFSMLAFSILGEDNWPMGLSSLRPAAARVALWGVRETWRN